jgi:RNA polymerase sigma factor (sigma-70 family)
LHHSILYQVIGNAHKELTQYVFRRAGMANYSVCYQDAEDIASKAGIEAMRKSDKIFSHMEESGQSLECAATRLLKMIAKNRLVDLVREKRRMQTRNRKAAESSIRDARDLIQELIAKDEADFALSVLEVQNPRQHELIKLRYFEKKSIKDIAHLFGNKPPSVRAMEKRALETLSKLIPRDT